MVTGKRDQSGQALLEMALILPIFVIFVLGVTDFSRAIYDREVTTNLAGEGSSLALRGSTLITTAATIMAQTDINMNGLGCVIVTSVNSPDGTSFKITGQAISTPCNTGSSQIGSCQADHNGNCTGSASVPSYVRTVLQANSSTTVYVTEVYYKFNYITSIGLWLKSNNILPARLYSVAYY